MGMEDAVKRVIAGCLSLLLVLSVGSHLFQWHIESTLMVLVSYVLLGWGFFTIRKLKLYQQILIAMVIAAGVAISVLSAGIPLPLEPLTPLGTIFIRLLKMIIVPLVVSSIIVGVSGIGDSKTLGRLGMKTLGYYFLTSLCAIVIGLFLSNLVQPGLGVSVPQADAIDASSLNRPGSIFDIVIRMIPTNPIQAFAGGDMLGLIFFSICFGVAMTRCPEAIQKPLFQVVNSVFQVMMNLTEMIIKLAPLGVFGLIVGAILKMEPAFFYSVAKYMLTIFVGLCLHLFVVLPLLLKLLSGRSPVRHFSDMANALMTAFSTSSSSSTLPVTMECIEKNAGVSNKVSSFVLPLGATVNMDGTALYECAGVLFISQVLGVDLTFGQQMVVVLTALLASIGAAGIPSAGLVMIFIVLEAVNLQGPTVGLIVGAMLAVDRPLDMMRTAVNIFSDSIGSVVVAKSEGELSS